MQPERYEANNPKAVESRKQKEKQRLEQQQSDLKTLLAMPEFRRYVWRHMNETCGMMKSSASPNGSTQSLNIGMQDVARALWAEIETIDALMLPLMMTEHHEAQK